MQKHNLIAAGIALLFIVAGAYYIYVRPVPSNSSLATSTATTTTVDGITFSGGSATVTETQNPKAPNYNTPLTFSASTDAAVRVALQKQFDATVAILDKDKTNFQAWANLGTLRKMTGDYTGAAADWSYLAVLYPQSTVAFDNLGELYLDFLKNYAKADADFTHSIALDPHDINAYEQLVSLYTTYGYKTKAAALVLVEQGLKANPDNGTLLGLKAQLQAQ